MKFTKTIISGGRDCHHRHTDNTVYAGLRRTVCQECGDVTLNRKTESKPGMLFRRPRAHRTDP